MVPRGPLGLNPSDRPVTFRFHLLARSINGARRRDERRRPFYTLQHRRPSATMRAR